jgi:hypothetical protein
MKERSQIEDMRAALRGDLERARSRGAGTLLQPESPVTPEPEAVPDVRAEAPEVSSPLSETPEPDAPEPEPPPEAVVEPEPEPEPRPEPPVGFLRSLFRRV